MNYYGLWRRANAAAVTSVTQKSGSEPHFVRARPDLNFKSLLMGKVNRTLLGQTINRALTPIFWF